MFFLVVFAVIRSQFSKFGRRVDKVWEPLPHIEGAPAGGMAPVERTASAGIAAITAHDPAFVAEAFLAEAQRAFFVVQQAWCECKPDLSRRVMGDSLWQQHRVGIERYLANRQHNVLDQLAVGDADIVAAESTGGYDTLTVRFLASSTDYDVDEHGKVVRGHKDVSIWKEDWVFQRSSDAVTKPGAGTLNQRCPNCGAPLDLDVSGSCRYCKVVVMSGAYDWVLTRISQVAG